LEPLVFGVFLCRKTEEGEVVVEVALETLEVLRCATGEARVHLDVSIMSNC
jgi:hypothetical protein